MSESILVVAAHPDDEVLGCGGTIARLAREGQEVFIAILGEGMTSRYGSRDDADQTLLCELHERSRKAAGVLGATDVFLHNLPDNRFDTVPLLEVVKMVEGFISRLQPRVVFTQHGGDLNIDHVVTYRATLTATRPMAGCCVRAVYAYEVASSSEWSFQSFEPTFRAEVFYNIAENLEQKIDAMQVYESEIREFPHPRSPEAIRAAARRWGSVVGVSAAEAFHCVREIR